VEEWTAIWRLVRDVLITLLGFFILAFEALRLGGNGNPRAELIAAGLLLVGVPAAARADKALRSAATRATERLKEARPDAGEDS